MTTAGYLTTVKIAGTSTAFTAAAVTLVSGTTYQITDTAKRILDPGQAVTVYDGVSPIAAANVTIDYLFGKVTLSTPPAGTVTVDGSYLPTVSVAECSQFSLSVSKTVLDTSSLDSAGYRVRVAGLGDVSGSLTSLALLHYDHDTGAGEKIFQNLFGNGTPVLLEIRPGNVGDYFRAWVLLEGLESSGGVDALTESTINFVGSARVGTGQTESAAYGWGS